LAGLADAWIKTLKHVETLLLLRHRAPMLRNSHIFLRKRVPSVFAGVFSPLLALRGVGAAFVGFRFRHGSSLG
jgi:hypothetical protein